MILLLLEFSCLLVMSSLTIASSNSTVLPEIKL